MARSRRRRLGQNFLVDSGIARRIVGLLGDDPPRVLEIGPGRGALTAILLERFAEVRALELDEALVAPLAARFAGANLDLVHGDALTIDWSEVAGDGPWQLASNLPYSVGTAILRRLLPHHDHFARLVVMLQREVAERVVAEPGDRNHGLMALERAAWADARIAFNVVPRAFRPVPKVTSAVVVLIPRPAPAPADRLRRALELAGRALTRPRKMLSNALGDDVAVAAVESAGLDPRTRPGQLALEDWLALARIIHE
jgi:16S rRNA (adenine1518-N6/adenine1519-N6)-dimethyltransferase